MLFRLPKGASSSLLPGCIHTDNVSSWGRNVTVISNLYLLQLQVPAAAGGRDTCDGLTHLDQSVCLLLKAKERSDNHKPFISGQN